MASTQHYQCTSITLLSAWSPHQKQKNTYMNADESAGLVFILAFNFITKRLIASINSLLQSPQLQHIGYHYRMM